MSDRIFDTSPNSWQDLEVLINQAFAEMGYETNRSHTIDTVRGSAEIDVRAIKTSTPIPTVVLCECKYWNKNVPQNVVHGFRTVCADAGAHFGIIISKMGFQSGAEEARHATNVHLMNFDEFQTTFFQEWISGAFLLMAKMRDQMLPIYRAAYGEQENGLDTVSVDTIAQIDIGKYSTYFGPNFFMQNPSFPSTINDPRGDPKDVTTIEVASYREYLEIAREGLVEVTKRFNLPEVYFSDAGEIRRPS